MLMQNLIIMNMITRESVTLFRNTNLFIEKVDVLYGSIYIRPEWAVQVSDSGLFVAKAPAIISIKEAVVLGAVAAIIANPVVSRRFWAGWTK